MPVLYNNNAITSLNGAITNVATSITVVSASVFPAVSSPDYVYLTITEGAKIEIIKVTDITGNVLTAARGQDGTAGQAFSDSSRIDLRLTTITLVDALADNVLTNSQIKTAYEANAETNEYSDAEQATVLSVESGADVTDTASVDAAGAFMNSDISPVEGILRKTGTGTYTAIKSNLSATTDPVVGSDSTTGYGIGSKWINITADSVWEAVDVSVGAAVWKELSIAAIGIVLQRVNVQDGAVASGTTIIPWDDTIPENTEGDEYIALTVTPINSSNILDIVCSLTFAHTIAGKPVIAALFQDSTAAALAVAWAEASTANQGDTLVLRFSMPAGTTSATTFKIRMGSDAGTLTFNGHSGARLFGGVAFSSITITEILS